MQVRQKMMPAAIAGWFVLIATSFSMVPLSTARAATLEVNNSIPCSNTTGAPYCTIGAAVGQAVAGDIISVATGTYTEQVTITRSGTAEAPIAIAANLGAIVKSGTYGFDLSGVSWITIDGFTVSNTTSHAFRCVLCSNVSLINNATKFPGGNGISISNSSDLTLNGNVVEDSKSHGIEVTASTRLNINGGSVTRSGFQISGKVKNGIKFRGTTVSNIERTLVHYNSDMGIYLIEGTTGVRVKGVTAHHNARGYERIAAGIESRSDGNIVESCIAYANEDSGINMRWGGSNGFMVNNITYRNGDHGIDVLESPNPRIINNTVYKNVTAGINVEGNSPNGYILNNISVDNGIKSPRTEGNIRATSTSIPLALNYNIVYSSGGEKLYLYWRTYFYTLAKLRAAYPSVEVNGIQADPRWVDRVLDDYRLAAGSPAIDSGKSDAVPTSEGNQDAAGNSRCDDPFTANTGIGPRTYDDRGAYEHVVNCPG